MLTLGLLPLKDISASFSEVLRSEVRVVGESSSLPGRRESTEAAVAEEGANVIMEARRETATEVSFILERVGVGE